ncbi:MAG: eamA-like transporter family protein [Massilia sp.]|jgi:O-acetylserine/cysteine efflux transporter|nr:eamA-like transporter family protein [Massilia sp.]MDB5949526.1 eamA-like transporter family protein [Massilia sp.]
MKQTMTGADIFIALGVVTIWGVNFVVIKIGLQDLPPILFSALRFLFAALPLVLFVKRPQTSFGLVLAYGLFQFSLQFTLLFTGIKLGLPAGLASLVVQLQAFFTIGLAVLMLGERPKAAQLLGALVALGGMALVAVHLDSKATLIGFVLVVLAAVCWAVANIVTKQMGQVGALSLVVWSSLVATPPLLLASWLVEGGAAWQLAFHNFSLKTLAAVLFQSYPNTILGFGIWSMLMRRYPTATVAPFSLLVPVAGMVSAALVLGEALQWWKLAAGGLVLGGLAMNQFGGRIWAKATALR